MLLIIPSILKSFRYTFHMTRSILCFVDHEAPYRYQCGHHGSPCGELGCWIHRLDLLTALSEVSTASRMVSLICSAPQQHLVGVPQALNTSRTPGSPVWVSGLCLPHSQGNGTGLLSMLGRLRSWMKSPSRCLDCITTTTSM